MEIDNKKLNASTNNRNSNTISSKQQKNYDDSIIAFSSLNPQRELKFNIHKTSSSNNNTLNNINTNNYPVNQNNMHITFDSLNQNQNKQKNKNSRDLKAKLEEDKEKEKQDCFDFESNMMNMEKILQEKVRIHETNLTNCLRNGSQENSNNIFSFKQNSKDYSYANNSQIPPDLSKHQKSFSNQTNEFKGKFSLFNNQRKTNDNYSNKNVNANATSNAKEKDSILNQIIDNNDKSRFSNKLDKYIKDNQVWTKCESILSIPSLTQSNTKVSINEIQSKENSSQIAKNNTVFENIIKTNTATTEENNTIIMNNVNNTKHSSFNFSLTQLITDTNYDEKKGDYIRESSSEIPVTLQKAFSPIHTNPNSGNDAKANDNVNTYYANASEDNDSLFKLSKTFNNHSCNFQGSQSASLNQDSGNANTNNNYNTNLIGANYSSFKSTNNPNRKNHVLSIIESQNELASNCDLISPNCSNNKNNITTNNNLENTDNALPGFNKPIEAPNSLNVKLNNNFLEEKLKLDDLYGCFSPQNENGFLNQNLILTTKNLTEVSFNGDEKLKSFEAKLESTVEECKLELNIEEKITSKNSKKIYKLKKLYKEFLDIIPYDYLLSCKKLFEAILLNIDYLVIYYNLNIKQIEDSKGRNSELEESISKLNVKIEDLTKTLIERSNSLQIKKVFPKNKSKSKSNSKSKEINDDSKLLVNSSKEPNTQLESINMISNNGKSELKNDRVLSKSNSKENFNNNHTLKVETLFKDQIQGNNKALRSNNDNNDNTIFKQLDSQQINSNGNLFKVNIPPVYKTRNMDYNLPFNITSSKLNTELFNRKRPKSSLTLEYIKTPSNKNINNDSQVIKYKLDNKITSMLNKEQQISLISQISEVNCQQSPDSNFKKTYFASKVLSQNKFIKNLFSFKNTSEFNNKLVISNIDKSKIINNNSIVNNNNSSSANEKILEHLRRKTEIINLSCNNEVLLGDQPSLKTRFSSNNSHKKAIKAKKQLREKAFDSNSLLGIKTDNKHQQLQLDKQLNNNKKENQIPYYNLSYNPTNLSNTQEHSKFFSVNCSRAKMKLKNERQSTHECFEMSKSHSYSKTKKCVSGSQTPIKKQKEQEKMDKSLNLNLNKHCRGSLIINTIDSLSGNPLNLLNNQSKPSNPVKTLNLCFSSNKSQSQNMNNYSLTQNTSLCSKQQKSNNVNIISKLITNYNQNISLCQEKEKQNNTNVLKSIGSSIFGIKKNKNSFISSGRKNQSNN